MDFASVNRTLNTVFHIAWSSDAYANYSIDIACTLTITGGEEGTVYLEYADNEAFTTNVTEVSRTVNGNTGTLGIGLDITQNSTAQLSGMIPYGKYVKIRTQNNTGTPTFTYRSGQEAISF